MANPYTVNQQIHSGMLNGVSGKWVPVEEKDAPMQVSNDPANPSRGADGAFYYSSEGTGFNAPTPIGANMNNAIPTPSQIVQLPPIVQPIAMVPYTTQNQPLVQYDPNYRPPVEKTVSPEPVYKPKPYVAISAFIALFAIAFIVVGCLAPVIGTATVLDRVLWLFTESDALNQLLGGDMSVLFTVLIPILFALAMVFCVIILINALVKIGKMKPLSKLNGWTLVSLILVVAGLIIMFVVPDAVESVGLGAYVMAGILVVMMILPLFINKKIMVLDYVASKQTYIVK